MELSVMIMAVWLGYTYFKHRQLERWVREIQNEVAFIEKTPEYYELPLNKENNVTS